jgi:hypothetical protein
VVPCAVMAAPLIKPAIAAPAINAFDVMLTFLFLCWFCPASKRHNTAGSVAKG